MPFLLPEIHLLHLVHPRTHPSRLGPNISTESLLIALTRSKIHAPLSVLHHPVHMQTSHYGSHHIMEAACAG